ncbi:MAG TPA: hypothetical protein VJ440_05045 [Candidatus Brocadiaceae bacterium]|nr:hypothetical protein [Candidatus Brocadiaceae bacterium]
MGEKKDDVKKVKELVVNDRDKTYVPKMERPDPWPEPPKQEDSVRFPNQNKRK